MLDCRFATCVTVYTVPVPAIAEAPQQNANSKDCYVNTFQSFTIWLELRYILI
jgi:hypothetical protein